MGNFDPIRCENYNCLESWKKLVSEIRNKTPEEIKDNILGLNLYLRSYNRIINQELSTKKKTQKMKVREKRIYAHIKQLNYYISTGEVITR